MKAAILIPPSEEDCKNSQIWKKWMHLQILGVRVWKLATEGKAAYKDKATDVMMSYVISDFCLQEVLTCQKISFLCMWMFLIAEQFYCYLTTQLALRKVHPVKAHNTATDKSLTGFNIAILVTRP